MVYPSFFQFLVALSVHFTEIELEMKTFSIVFYAVLGFYILNSGVVEIVLMELQKNWPDTSLALANLSKAWSKDSDRILEKIQENLVVELEILVSKLGRKRETIKNVWTCANSTIPHNSTTLNSNAAIP